MKSMENFYTIQKVKLNNGIKQIVINDELKLKFIKLPQ